MIGIAVIEFASDRILWRATLAESNRLIARGHARRISKDEIRLTATASLVPGEYRARQTRISSGGLMAAIGKSQVYTTRDGRSRVDGFKTLYREDKAYFVAAVTGERV